MRDTKATIYNSHVRHYFLRYTKDPFNDPNQVSLCQKRNPFLNNRDSKVLIFVSRMQYETGMILHWKVVEKDVMLKKILLSSVIVILSLYGMDLKYCGIFITLWWVISLSKCKKKIIFGVHVVLNFYILKMNDGKLLILSSFHSLPRKNAPSHTSGDFHQPNLAILRVHKIKYLKWKVRVV